jgi:predicted DNA-binding antitoxin AbrB/MazE fold protein
MTKTIQAVFEKGVFRPLTPLNIPDQEKVTLTVSRPEDGIAAWEDRDCYEACMNEVDDGVTLEQVQNALAKIAGTMTADFIAEREER